MNQLSIETLKTLTETPGVSGFETPVRKVLNDFLSPLSSHITTDRLGSLIAVREGTGSGPKIMLAAHMDEVGFMVSQITEEGYLKFQELGGWWEQVLLGQRVEVLTSSGRITGVIGAKAPHILTPEEKKQPVKMKAMYVDVGSTGQEETQMIGIKPGDPVVPFSPFVLCKGEKTVMAKALDDRAGCAIVIDVFRGIRDFDYPGTLHGVMTVQEEVGLRGASTSVDAVDPDLAIVVDVAVATDTPGLSDTDVSTRTYLGKGPIIGFYDASMIPHLLLRDLVTSIAADNSIPYQVAVMSAGGTDAGKIHLYHKGVPSVVIGMPVRYIHSHVGVAHLEDYSKAVELILAVVRSVNAEALNNLHYKA